MKDKDDELIEFVFWDNPTREQMAFRIREGIKNIRKQILDKLTLEKKDIYGIVSIYGAGSPDACMAIGRNETIDELNRLKKQIE